jgi:hypothetical protein
MEVKMRIGSQSVLRGNAQPTRKESDGGIVGSKHQVPPEIRAGSAYHEAGHAVAAIVLGRCVRKIDICLEGCFGGKCELTEAPRWFRHESASSPRFRSWVENEIIIRLAGQVSKYEYLGLSGNLFPEMEQLRPEMLEDKPLRTTLEQTDYFEILWLQRRLCSTTEETNRLLNDLIQRTEAIVRKHWRAIESIAKCLLVREAISGRLARRLFQEATGHATGPNA